MEWFLSRAEAKAVIEAWRRHYNEVRPHSSLGYLTPAEFAAKLKTERAAPASATGRDAARHGGFAPRPVAAPSLKGQTRSRRRRFSQLKRGPKNRGRSTTLPSIGSPVDAVARVALPQHRRPTLNVDDVQYRVGMFGLCFAYCRGINEAHFRLW